MSLSSRQYSSSLFKSSFSPLSQEPTKPPKQKSEEKKIAWKFGRGGSQDGWSVRPAPNSGYPLWKKEVQVSPAAGPQVEQGADADGKKNNDQQAYIVWSVGQGNAPNGWNLSKSAVYLVLLLRVNRILNSRY